IPLLFETGGEALCDFVILCSVDIDTQRQRALKRQGMTAEKFEAIVQNQMPLAAKQAKADAVIRTDRGVEAARADLQAILDGPVDELRRRQSGGGRDA
ncbi:MAG: dephospho-CoA kinase, partial [Alphaproteobacteria bacterium]